jgi:predicted small lipoprotein YifL
MRTILTLMLAALIVTGCGKKGPLVYPEMLVTSAPSDVSVQQFGNSAKLSFVLPSKDLAGRNLAGLSGIAIMKRDEISGQISVCSSCTSDFILFRKLNLDLLPPEARRYGSLLVLIDGDVQAGRTYTYRVSAITKDRLEGPSSVPLTIAMEPSFPPPELKVLSHPTEIRLEFSGLPPRGGALLGYNIYRTLNGDVFPLLPLNKVPMLGNVFVDSGLERRTLYKYAVRTVVRLPSGSTAESSLSSEVDAKLKDDE